MLMHKWDVSTEEALTLQEKLRSLVRLENDFGEIKSVAGIDATYEDGQGRAAVVVYSFPELELVDQSMATQPVTFPYVPGLLSFREGPVALAALEKLRVQPDLLLLDGQGFAHPRRFGLACHLGVYLDKPAIGCAKTRLLGTYEEPGPSAGDFTLLQDGVETIGAVLRTKPGTNPIYVSIGHKVELATALKLVIACVKGFRLPEPTRMADIMAGKKLV